MAHVGVSFHPDQEGPESGVYECDADDSHCWSVTFRGHRFHHCRTAAKGHG
jgi:hypothetical protein